MNLIDILVEELPKRGGWPEGVSKISSTSCGRAFFDGQSPHGFTLPVASDAWDSHKHPFSYTNAVTRDQYEAALSAKNDGWIEWGGGECPVPTGTLVDVRYRNGEENHHVGAGIFFDDTGSNPDRNAEDWNNDGSPLDIIAYRLHQPQEAVQPKADDEADLNECIGQDSATVWNGEGVIPLVGFVCELSWGGDEWQSCKILFASGQIVVVKLKESGMEDAYNIGDVTFRPTRQIRSEAELKREEAVKAIMLTGWCQSAAEEIYDLIAAGKVPGMKLEV